MGDRKAIYTLVDPVVSVTTLLVRVCRPVAAPILRLLRLAGLRASCRGVVPSTTRFDGPVHANANTRLVMGDYCRLGRGAFFETVGNGAIRLGSHVRLNAGCTIVSYAEVRIGDDCLIGEYVTIRDANHGTDPGQPMRLQEHDAAPIAIGDNVWLGRGVMVGKGVTIGSGAVVAANSVVTKDVPSGTVVAGVPAKVIRDSLG
ncbi:MAG: acyltransferase [Candidatus Hydrogenedentes bacterium]|nr:acyltransferase [Candidatus Hydrogenedentota bacterium]